MNPFVKKFGNPFNAYYLLNNPFPTGAAILSIDSISDFKKQNKIFVREVRDTELIKLFAFLDEASTVKEPRHLWITGNKGTGKTALLVQAINEINLLQNNKYIPVYVSMPYAGEQFATGIFNTLVTHMDGQVLRQCVAGLLKKTVAEHIEGADYPEFRNGDIRGFQEKLEHGDSEIIDRILFQGTTPFQITKEFLGQMILMSARRHMMGEAVNKSLEKNYKQRIYGRLSFFFQPQCWFS